MAEANVRAESAPFYPEQSFAARWLALWRRLGNSWFIAEGRLHIVTMFDDARMHHRSASLYRYLKADPARGAALRVMLGAA